MGLPHPVHDRRMAGIAGGAVVEFAAEVNDLHDGALLENADPYAGVFPRLRQDGGGTITLARQPERYFRNVGDTHQDKEHHRIEWPDLAHDLFDGDFGERAADEEDSPDRRVAQPDAEIEQHDNPN